MDVIRCMRIWPLLQERNATGLDEELKKEVPRGTTLPAFGLY